VKRSSIGIIVVVLIGLLALHGLAAETSSAVNKLGKISIGMTKNQVIKLLGQPNSPKDYDFIYGAGDNEMIVTFDNKKKVESIIIKGKDLTLDVAGIKIGSPASLVEGTFGKPEYVKKYIFFKREVWSYPSSNVYFSCKDGKVVSFAVSCCNYFSFKKKVGSKI